MSESRQRAYLEALEIPVWVSKELAAQVPDFISPCLKLGPGSGHVLLVCSALEEPASRIASDIARCLRSEPVWAWPDPDGPFDDITGMVREKLFTSIVMFGEPLKVELFGASMPETMGSARLFTAPGIDELAASPSARRSLWQLIRGNGLTGHARA